MAKNFILSFVFFITFIVEPGFTQDSAEISSPSFDRIKSVLANDDLSAEARKNKQIEEKQKADKQRALVKKFDLPSSSDFWDLMSELWIVKNTPILKWDIEKPDYGIRESFSNFLQSVGMPNRKFRLLLTDSPTIPHLILPSRTSEYVIILSIPFMRSMDLSKTEISILLFEDIIRIEKAYFQKFVADDQVTKLIGSNFYGKKIPDDAVTSVLAKYDKFIFDKGYDFQQQFEITMTVVKILNQDAKYLEAYKSLLNKIGDITKTQSQYREYSKIYPSPDMQLKWILPPAKVL